MTTDIQISDRELEILQLVATGATNQQIAQQLHISVNTVKVHLRNIFGKIGVASRTEATVYAMRMGLVPMAHEGAPPAEAEQAPPADAPTEQTAPDTAVEETAIEPGSAPDEPVRTVPADHAVATTTNDPTPPVTVTPVFAANRRFIVVSGGMAALLLLIAVVVVVTRQFSAATPTPTTGTEGLNVPVPDKPWRELAPLTDGRAGFAMADVAYGGRSYIYTIGGEDSSGVGDQVLRYDINANTWVPRRAKPQPVSDVQAAVIGNKIYVPGGRLASGQPTNACEAYDPNRDTWATCKSLPAPRSGYALTAVEGKLYMFGGWDGTNYSDEVWQYNPDTDEWAALSKMPTARAFADAIVMDRQVYVIGGENQQGALPQTSATRPRKMAAEPMEHADLTRDAEQASKRGYCWQPDICVQWLIKQSRIKRQYITPKPIHGSRSPHHSLQSAKRAHMPSVPTNSILLADATKMASARRPMNTSQPSPCFCRECNSPDACRDAGVQSALQGNLLARLLHRARTLPSRAHGHAACNRVAGALAFSGDV